MAERDRERSDGTVVVDKAVEPCSFFKRFARRFANNDKRQLWTAKDLLGHLGAFEVRFADVVAGFAGEEPESDLMSADPRTFNDDQAAVRKDWPIEQVMSEFLDAHERVMRHASAIAPEVWREVGTIAWYGPEYSLNDLVVYQMYGHKREHDPQLGAVLEQRSG